LRPIVFIFLALIFTGCVASKGFDRAFLRDSSGQAATDQDIKAVLELKPQLPSPFKLAVYLNPSANYRRAYWTDTEKNALLAYGNELKEARVISEVNLVSDATVQVSHMSTFPIPYRGSNNLKDLRLAAARYGADALLIINDASSVDRYNNPAAFFYLTIIGAYLVPGTHSEALVMIKASLWDVRNEYLYATEEAEGIAKRIGPAFVLEDVDSIDQAKHLAIADFGKKFTDRLIRLNADKH
jgi:rhombotail lipoprotein